jgi:Reverse transcriptase (RNA-dependent DNA polymerase)
MLKPSNISRERAAIRAGSSVLLRTDVSQFYPSLYTHAVGWAVDPKLRKKTNWTNTKLLGKRLDQALMDLDGKVSQGIPIGTDISFLLAEIVLAQVDKALKRTAGRSFRWYDDYELAFDTNDQAEGALKKLTKELGKFRLRLNAKKTEIVRLPIPAQHEWQHALGEAGAARFFDPRDAVRYFDVAFRLRKEFPDEAILSYSLGKLFKLAKPNPQVARIFQSCLTQAVLCEPGAAQKAFALLSWWHLNGLVLDSALITDTVNQMIVRHEASGFSSDIAWALSFCLDQNLILNSKAGRALSYYDDDCVALQALDMHSRGLLPTGFDSKRISKILKHADLDREHWLVAYESVRHGFLTASAQAVKKHPFFSDLLKHRVSFYRTSLPPYASIIHPGGAPEWMVEKWMQVLTGKSADEKTKMAESRVQMLLRADFKKIGSRLKESTDLVAELISRLVPPAEVEDGGEYPA